jgi:hypothetical protein
LRLFTPSQIRASAIVRQKIFSHGRLISTPQWIVGVQLIRDEISYTELDLSGDHPCELIIPADFSIVSAEWFELPTDDRYINNNSSAPVSMPWPNSDPTPDPAVAAALAAQTALLTSIAANTNPDIVADAIANNNYTTETIPNVAVAATLTQILQPDPTRQTVSLVHQSGANIKIWASSAALPTSTTFSSAGAIATLKANNPAGEANAVDAKAGWYAICQNGIGAVNVTLSRTTN